MHALHEISSLAWMGPNQHLLVPQNTTLSSQMTSDLTLVQLLGIHQSQVKAC